MDGNSDFFFVVDDCLIDDVVFLIVRKFVGVIVDKFQGCCVQ